MDMENDVIATEELSDNSEIEENTEPSNDDNSEENDQEPENNEEAEAENTSRFASIEEATKAHAELQKKLGLQSNELGELRKEAAEAAKLREQLAAIELQEAKEKGFESVSEYNNSKELANCIADEYAKHIKECEYPDEMKKMLDSYRTDPDEEMLEAIEAQFSLKTVKEVAGQTEIFKGELQNKQNEALMNEIRGSAAAYLNENVAKYKEDFKNPAFAALYGEAFRAYGVDLDTDKFVELMRSFASEAIKANAIKKAIVSENDSDTDEIAGLSSGNNGTNSKGGKSLLTMSSEELDKRLDELI